ncbi:MAG: sulfur oxidation c-type cytochrome SoxA [Gammaproteobacteria bacterium]
MLKNLLRFFICFSFIAANAFAADVAADRREFREFYKQRFPELAVNDFVYGVYAIDEELRRQWEQVNEFPPYEFVLDEGQSLVAEPFPSGEGLLDCLGPKPVARHPYFDDAEGRIITLGAAVNACRLDNGQTKLSYQKQPLQAILARLSFLERGQARATPEPSGAVAQAAYERGKAFFYTKRGQLNLSCANCHMQAVGKHLREQTLAPLLGVVNHFPIYSLRAGALGSLHQRFVGCVEQVRGESPHLESREFRELEYFLSLMANGLPIVGPSTQR